MLTFQPNQDQTVVQIKQKKLSKKKNLASNELFGDDFEFYEQVCITRIHH